MYLICSWYFLKLLMKFKTFELLFLWMMEFKLLISENYFLYQKEKNKSTINCTCLLHIYKFSSVTVLNRCIPNATGESVKSFFSKTGIQTFLHVSRYKTYFKCPKLNANYMPNYISFSEFLPPGSFWRSALMLARNYISLFNRIW